MFAGFFGAFTTMSTFALDTTVLFSNGRFGDAAMNLFGTAVLCLGGAAAGRWAGIALAA